MKIRIFIAAAIALTSLSVFWFRIKPKASTLPILRRSIAQQSVQPQSLPVPFLAVIGPLRSEATVPIFLPSNLPDKGALDASFKVTPEGYAVALDDHKTKLNVALFGATTRDKPDPDFDRSVTLEGGIRGYYLEQSCGGSCSPPRLQWQFRNVLYQISFFVNSTDVDQDERIVVGMANSAIKAGPR